MSLAKSPAFSLSRIPCISVRVRNGSPANTYLDSNLLRLQKALLEKLASIRRYKSLRNIMLLY